VVGTRFKPRCRIQGEGEGQTGENLRINFHRNIGKSRKFATGGGGDSQVEKKEDSKPRQRARGKFHLEGGGGTWGTA